jgi:hypothetical protein
MQTKTVFQLDEDGFLIGVAVADESPLEEGVFLLPAGCVEVEPLPHVEGKRQQFVNGVFQYVDIPREPEPASPTAAELWTTYQAEAKAAFAESDLVATRCFKAGVPYPTEWQAYDNSLRGIVRATAGDPTEPFPARPEYPAGT